MSGPIEPEEPDPGHDEGFVAAERTHRLGKLDALRARGVDPYPVRFERDRTLGELRESYDGLADGEEAADTVRVAGRLALIRRHGKLIFADLRDRAGAVQLMVARDDVGSDSLEAFDDLDLGDWVGVQGRPLRTRRGELSVRVDEWQLLSKALRPLPGKGSGLDDVETRFRERHLDLIVNPESRRVAQVRGAAIAALRAQLLAREYLEVDTPVLDVCAGGALARPFVTHHNALDLDMYMRIALELPLKKLIVGGLERVFEIGRVFRNEGIDTRHNPEFTMLEAYQAFADYEDMLELTEALVAAAAQDATGSTRVGVAGREVDLAPPYRRVPMADLIREHTGVDMHPTMDVNAAREAALTLGARADRSWGAGRLMVAVYEATCEAELIEPTFVLHHPLSVSPLARAHRDDPALAERFELVVGGLELANAYSELNDPVEQQARFAGEASARAAGDEEAHAADADYVRALEAGLPPTGGMGMGLDRLTMLLSGSTSIREVILFPTMRPLEA